MAEKKTDKTEAKAADKKSTQKEEAVKTAPTKRVRQVKSAAKNDDKSRGKKRGRGGRGRKNQDEFDKRIVSIRRVTRVYKGGKRMRLSVMVVAGDKKGRVGAGIGKGADVRSAEEKAYNQAKKNMVSVNLKGTTIPHQTQYKKGAAKVFMKPAAPGTGVIAGGAVRDVLEVVGISDILTKIIGSNNSVSNVYTTIEALQSLLPARSNVKQSK